MSSSSLHLVSILLILFISRSSSADDSPSFSSILRSHGLPIGLVPNRITSFTVDPATGRFEIILQRACNAKFENRVHYDFNVTGLISYGQIADLSGMSAQELFLWFPVKEIRVDVPSSGLIYFDVGGVVFKQFSLSLFDAPPECLDVETIDVDQEFVTHSDDLKDRLERSLYHQQGNALRASS
uniref:Uncharacterized protein n=1 Tax=Kalanchoe fedtschenkoi TaxID=63787 RepID=A0A7N1A050_KALFE